jgi:DNA-binding NarL/FixJ family response regulator
MHYQTGHIIRVNTLKERSVLVIKVLIVDDQTLLRESLKETLEHTGEITVCGCAENGAIAEVMCRELQPDLVLMDINMPVCGGIDGTCLIKKYNAGIKVLILTTFYEENYISEALLRGADGFIMKDVAPDILITAIKNTYNGLHILGEKPYRFLSRELTYKQEMSDCGNPLKEGNTLNEKEFQIIWLIADGKNNKDIAAEIYLSEGCVKNIISGIFTKLKLRDRYQLICYAYRNNIIK